MFPGVSAFGEIGFAQIPDPDALRQGAIVARLSTNPAYNAETKTAPKINGTVITSPGK